MVETNIFWPYLNPKDRWENRIEGRWEAQKSVLAYNITDDANSAWQPGGCLQVSVNRAAHRVISCGSDKSGLGRWAWTRYRGRHNVTLRVVSAYRPCSSLNAGERTVLRQHERFLLANGDEHSPRDAMLADLCSEILLWREAGDQIVLCIDLNEDVSDSPGKRVYLHSYLLRSGLGWGYER